MKGYFTLWEKLLWGGSAGAILICFFCFDGESLLSLTASLLGVSSLILLAKGNPLGHGIGIVFGMIYVFLSYRSSYYGEMLIYLCITIPMGILSLVSWLRHPFAGKRAEVRVDRATGKDWCRLFFSTVLVTGLSFFLLDAFGTANLAVSTVSVATSYGAAFLAWKRSPYYALIYAANDVVLVLLWGMEALQDPGAVSVTVLFVTFLFHDLYAFFQWRKMARRQKSS